MATEQVRFGRAVEDLPEQLEFGTWGVLEMSSALDQLEETHAYFDSEEVRKSEDDRRAMILAARRYYDGNHIKPLKVQHGEPDDNVLVNLCRTLVDDGVAWLFGNPETGVLQMDVTPAAEPEGGEKQADVQTGKLLEQIYERSGGFHFFKRLGMRGSLAGHFFLKIVPGDDLPHAAVLDPMLCSVRTDPADSARVIAYKVEWKREETAPNTRKKEQYIYRQLVVNVGDVPGEDGQTRQAWVVGDFKCKDRSKREWKVVNGPWAWPWDWAPVVDGPNLEAGWGYYGLSDLEDVAPLNDSYNFVASNTMRIIKHHAHPKTIGTGVNEGEVIESAIDSFWTIENPEAKITNLEMQSDLTSSLNLMEVIRNGFWTIGRGLDLSVYKDRIGAVTNFGLRVLANRALQKMGDKRLSYGKGLRELNRRMLEMLEKPGMETVIKWPKPLPEDPVEDVNRQNVEVTMGTLSRQTAAEERGRSWDVEKKRIQQENKERASLGQTLLEEFDRDPRRDENDEDQEPEDEPNRQ